MGLKKGSKLNPEKCILQILDNDFIQAFLNAYVIDKNVTFYQLAGKESFLNIFLAFLNIDEEIFSKLLGDRLYNRYRQLKSKIYQLINDGI